MEIYKLSPAFHADRRQELSKRLNAAGLDLLMVFDPTSIAYLTGFFHMTTERPIGVGFLPDGHVFCGHRCIGVRPVAC
jgi:Xaa-Pro aminopeptidase